MNHDKAFQKALELSIAEKTDYVVFRSEMCDYGAMRLDIYTGYDSDIVCVFENGLMLE